MSEKELVLDAKEWDEFFRKLKGNTAKAAKFLKVAASTEGFRDIVDHFDKESGPGGGWKELKVPRSGKILQLTGRLRQSILPESGGVREAGDQAVIMYSNVIYGRTHDQGDPGRNIPQREFMWLSGKAQQAMANMVRSLLLENS